MQRGDKMSKNELIIGGDKRMVYCADFLGKSGLKTYAYGFSDSDFKRDFFISKNLFSYVKNADTVILPTPFSKDNTFVFSPLCDEKILISDVLKNMKKGAFLFGGNLSESVLEDAKKYEIFAFDLLKDEELAVKNASLCGEGALLYAISSSDKSLLYSNCLITGFGRIGKTSANIFKNICAKTYVYARKETDRSYIMSYGYIPVSNENLKNEIENIDIVINTVPYMIFDESIISNMKNDAVIIDTASYPGGVDNVAALKHGIKTVSALALPGKVSPADAGFFMGEAILKILSENGGKKCLKI